MIDPNLSILLVDDSAIMRQTTERTLRDAGYEHIYAASGGAEALYVLRDRLAKGAAFDVILLDWNMPEISGLELLQQCRGNLGLHDLPILMLTAVTDGPSVRMALAQGATAYLSKPIDPDLLIEKVSHFAHSTPLAEKRA